MSRHLHLVLFLVPFFLSTLPVQAGEASYIDMRGKWESTQCKPPQALGAHQHDPEAAANDLNARVMQHNQFVSEAKAYMDCLSEEAKRDASAMSYLATETVNKLIQDMAGSIEASSLQIKKAQEEDKSFF